MQVEKKPACVYDSQVRARSRVSRQAPDDKWDAEEIFPS